MLSLQPSRRELGWKTSAWVFRLPTLRKRTAEAYWLQSPPRVEQSGIARAVKVAVTRWLISAER